MRDVPEIGILAADAGKVGPRALRAPEHRAVVLGFHGERIRAVTLDLVAQGADHLAVAGVAALADVDVAAGQFQRRVDPHVRRVLDGLVDGEERRDLDDAADAGGGDDRDDETDGGALKLAVKQFGHHRHSAGLRRGGQAPVRHVGPRCPAAARHRAGPSSRCCRQPTIAPSRKSRPPKARAM